MSDTSSTPSSSCSSSSSSSSPGISVCAESFISVGKHLSIDSCNLLIDHIQIVYSLDGAYKFLTKVVYPRGILEQLIKTLSADNLRRFICHVALIEGLKFIAVFPQTFNINEIADGLSEASLKFFALVSARAWTQHFYENGVSDYWAPKFIHQKPLGCSDSQPIRYLTAENLSTVKFGKGVQPNVLVSNGGGKDSFLVMKTLELADIPVSVFQHARTEYGRLDHQHAIQKKIFPHVSNIQQVHEISVFDDFTDGVMQGILNPKLKGESILGRPCQVGWPEMVFEALPFIICNKYTSFVLGNERSADSTQAEWDALGDRQINHQWLKSYEAATALQTFLNNHLLADLRVFSLLKPIHDYRIYQRISSYSNLLFDVHSCNITKPWCKKCAKCAYVFGNFCAIWGHEKVISVFNSNLFDDEELKTTWSDLLGISEHGRQAWECVGEHDEMRLALKKAYENGAQGIAIELFKKHFVDGKASEKNNRTVDWKALIEKFDKVYDEKHGIPQDVFDRVKAFL